jgi:hypothetical protein
MGIHYSFNLAIGYIITEKEIFDLFLQRTPEEFHLEDRFDPKTGLKVQPLKVIDRHASGKFMLDGKQYGEGEDPESYMPAICKKITGARWWWHSYLNDNRTFIIGPVLPQKVTDDFDDGRVKCSGGFGFNDVVALAPRLGNIAAGMKKLGFEITEPVIVPAWCVG